MTLTKKELELVAIGSAIGGNCIPCLEWHYQECRKLGFSQQELAEAIAIAKEIKEVPIDKIYETAEKLNCGGVERKEETCSCVGDCC
jgi:4-carboxymuconolactone decarboxylase